MALTRKSLKAMGLTDEQIESVIDMHTETVDGLKAQINEQKEAAAKLEEVTKERDDLKKEAAKKGDADKKYNDLKTEFDNFKKDVEAKETKAAKEKAYRALLKDAKISEKRLDAILKVTSLDDIELDAEGKIKDADKLTESVKKEWADFIVKEGEKGADTKTPPENNGGAGGTGGTSRAAQLAAKYHANLYGSNEKEKK